jgi:hypothetical protein
VVLIFISFGLMNKARRHELKMLKYKRRLNNLGLKESPNSNFNAYRSHGSPCSCIFCSGVKYSRAKVKSGLNNEVEFDLSYQGEGGQDDLAYEILCRNMYDVE